MWPKCLACFQIAAGWKGLRLRSGSCFIRCMIWAPSWLLYALAQAGGITTVWQENAWQMTTNSMCLMWCAFYSQWGKDKPINDKKTCSKTVTVGFAISTSYCRSSEFYATLFAGNCRKLIQYGLSSFLCAIHIITDNNSACLFTCITLV